MIRPMDTDAMSWRHSSLDSCCLAGPSEYIATRMPGADHLEQGTRSLVAGPLVPLAAAGVLVVEDAHRVGRRLSAALHAELGEQRGHVVLHGLLGQEHPLADLPVGQPFPDQLQDPALLPAEPGQRIAFGGLIPPPGPSVAAPPAGPPSTGGRPPCGPRRPDRSRGFA